MERCTLNPDNYCLPGQDGKVDVESRGEIKECTVICSKRFRFEKLAELTDSTRSLEEMADMVTGRPINLGC